MGEKRREREKERDYDRKEEKKKKERDNRDRDRKKHKEKKIRRHHSRHSESDSSDESPEDVVKCILEEFPSVAGDLEQLLKMVDSGQAVDIGGLSERALVRHLRSLFESLNLKEKGHDVFLLRGKSRPTLDVVGSIIYAHLESQKEVKMFDTKMDTNLESPDSEHGCATDSVINAEEAATGSRTRVIGPEMPSAELPKRFIGPEMPSELLASASKRVIGPEMPSAELLAAAAKLNEAEAELREAELDMEGEFFIGPPPPAVVKEAASANEAERFEEITRILDAEVNSPYDILGVNKNMPAESIKKRFWKLSLIVHPDKCSHPQAHQAFVKLNKAFKDLHDPETRKALDDKIKLKEEQEAFQVELKQMREAAQWRRLQGIAMEGDDALLAELDAKAERRRDEWMTELPPERKPGVSMHMPTGFSKTAKEGRGDTSSWTETPSERAHKAKMKHLEALSEVAAVTSNEQQKKKTEDLVNEFNELKRSKTLVEKHQELSKAKVKKKRMQEGSKEEWEGSHPWKPWDREKDLAAGRQQVKLDAENMAQGLTSRFASGSFQKNFL